MEQSRLIVKNFPLNLRQKISTITLFKSRQEVLCFVIIVDADECQFPDACGSDHVCNNTVGSYTCECPLGYVEDSGPQNPLNPVCVGENF